MARDIHHSVAGRVLRLAFQKGAHAAAGAQARGLGRELFSAMRREGGRIRRTGLLARSVTASHSRPAAALPSRNLGQGGLDNDYERGIQGHVDETIFVTVTAGYAGHVEHEQGFASRAIEALTGERAGGDAVVAAERAAGAV